MTKNAEGLYEYKVTAPTAKKYQFKILQDCDGYGWANAYGENGKLTGIDNGSVTVDVDNSEVVITIDPATLEVKVTVTAPSTPAGGDETPAGGNSGNVNAGDSMAVAAAVIAVVACGIVAVSFKKRRQDA